ncbi:MAG: fumarylacetoacetate hydrolase family protein [Rhodococcus sp. (in: high G+C Gram-positive bacteria)]|uniref:2-keto-4-pentenoate hydratase n=1 Tax=Rhodococcus sp. TaxID=1831 RepID=UPI003BB0BA17
MPGLAEPLLSTNQWQPIPPSGRRPGSIADAAARLRAAERDRTPCAPVRDMIGACDIETAYAVQSRIVAEFVDAGRILSGRKIGLTSLSVQAQLGVDQPDFGVLFADMDCSSGGPVDLTRCLQPRIEAEVAFVLGADIDTVVDEVTVRRFVEAGAPALEIVDSRVSGWDITLGDTIADNASSGLYVLGRRVPAGDLPELAGVSMSMTENDAVVSTGVGADCLGSPWAALAWLANISRRLGAPLQAGELVLSGALGPMVPVTAGSSYSASISGLGSVSATFTSGART